MGIDREVVLEFNKNTGPGQRNTRIVTAKKRRKLNGIPRERLELCGNASVGLAPLYLFRDELITFV